MVVAIKAPAIATVGQSTRRYKTGIYHKFNFELRRGLACRIARKSCHIGLWIVTSKAIAPNGITHRIVRCQGDEIPRQTVVQVKRTLNLIAEHAGLPV
jgi:hypothetical protein